jgi:hypothetical protein
LAPVDWSGRRLTPRKCYRIFFVRGQIRGCKSKSCGMNELSETPQERSCKEAHGRASRKHSASGQAETACPCDDYSKKQSLVERKSTSKFNTAYKKNENIVKMRTNIIATCLYLSYD